MITRVQVKNFRSLADVDVALGPLTVLVGRNGAGKSTFVDALRFVRDALLHNLSHAISEQRNLINLFQSPTHGTQDIEIKLTIKGDNSGGKYTFVIVREKGDEHYIKHEKCQWGDDSFETGEGAWISVGTNFHFSQNELTQKINRTELILPAMRRFGSQSLEEVYQLLTRTHFYTIFPNILRDSQKPSPGVVLEDNFSNLATTLKQIIKTKDWFPDLLSSLKHVVEDINDIRVRSVGSLLMTELKHGAQNGHTPWIDLAQESDGTLRILSILVALYQGGPLALTAIEDPELTLHPGALGVVSAVLKEASLRSQILITTQSPDLISRFEADELRIVEKVDGVTQIGPLMEHQREAINEQLFSAGDLLRIEGLRRAPVTVAEANNA